MIYYFLIRIAEHVSLTYCLYQKSEPYFLEQSSFSSVNWHFIFEYCLGIEPVTSYNNALHLFHNPSDWLSENTFVCRWSICISVTPALLLIKYLITGKLQGDTNNLITSFGYFSRGIWKCIHKYKCLQDILTGLRQCSFT